jgi:hypothetical protein
MCSDFALLLFAGKPKEQRKVMIAQIAPAVRVAIAEAIGLNPGEVSVGQLVAGLRQLGFDYVFGESRTASSSSSNGVPASTMKQQQRWQQRGGSCAVGSELGLASGSCLFVPGAQSILVLRWFAYCVGASSTGFGCVAACGVVFGRFICA